MVSFQSGAGSTDPIFPGGVLGLQRFMSKNQRPLAVPVTGTVFVEFVVKADGSVGDCVVLDGLSPEADREALRLVASLPNWTPGTSKGKPASCTFTLPVDFTG
jgi:periplasmic protein TonB